MQTIRAFIAIQIPDAVKAKFDEVQRALQQSAADVRWVKPGSAHITLFFLGDTPVEKIEHIQSALTRVAASRSAFDISLAGLGVFPNARRPRVVWIGITRGADSLAALQSSVSREMRGLGFQSEDREYSPHITLGRVKSPENLDRLRPLLDAKREFRAGDFHAAEIHLIKSVLSSEGPAYTTLFTAALRTPPDLRAIQ